jgi:hypothetical protein
MMDNLLRGRQRQVPCTIEIERTWETLHAHLNLDEDVEIEPGDEVRVLGEPIQVDFGDRKVLKRQAVVKHAGLLERIWTKITGGTELMELLEFSFSPRRRL